MQNVHFLSGIPRSGSTVLAAILSQNPRIFTSATSSMLEVIESSISTWDSFATNQVTQDVAQIKNICAGICSHYWLHKNSPVVFDKHRSWPKNTKIIDCIAPNAKIITTMRDIPSVLASYITLLDKTSDNYIDVELEQKGIEITNANRCLLLWEGYISVPWISLKIGWSDQRHRMHVVEYDKLLQDPVSVLAGIYECINEDVYWHLFQGITNKEPENDSVWGLKGLHDIKDTLQRHSLQPEKILGQELTEYWKSRKLEFWRA